nr:Ig-like domain-containing protein [Bacteroidota bacterium]
MFSRLSQFSPFLPLIALMMASCASPSSPTGGDPDKTPPKIISEESTPNQQTNFTGKEVVIVFDEWVTLKDVYNQLVVSPIMPEEPEIKLKGKGIIITLPDSLSPNTTYT